MINTITICGSLRKDYELIKEAIKTFEKNNIKVISPMVSRIINPDSQFVIFEHDETRNARKLENKHFDAIDKSDVVYFVNPKGYIGFSTSLELGYSVKCGKNIIFYERPNEEVLEEFSTIRIYKPKELIEKIIKEKELEQFLIYYEKAMELNNGREPYIKVTLNDKL